MTTGDGAGPVAPRNEVSHLPVMPAEVLRYLAPQPGEVHVDATVGCGGHARLIAEALRPGGLVIGIDRDIEMLRRARAALADLPHEAWRLFQAGYAQLDEVLEAAEVERVDGLLIDAGFNSVQVDDPSRGFSYREDGPLDMRYDDDARSAADLINTLDEAELARIFRDYGEERYARRIARRIVAVRAERRIERTGQLAALIEAAVPSRMPRRHHPARRVFQALRIAANDELGQLDAFLAQAAGALKPGGRLVVLSYHSLEDRLVKQALRRDADAGRMEIVTRRPVGPTDAETDANPRARSAKLRAAVRIDREGA